MRILKTTSTQVFTTLRMLKNTIVNVSGLIRTGTHTDHWGYRIPDEYEWRGTFLAKVEKCINGTKFYLCNIKGDIVVELRYTNSITNYDTLIFTHVYPPSMFDDL